MHCVSRETVSIETDTLLAALNAGYMEAINITAIAGDKGHHPYTCEVCMRPSVMSS